MKVRAVAVDIDDTLNDFTRTLRDQPFEFDPAWGLSRPDFDRLLPLVRAGAPDPEGRVSSPYTYLTARIHQFCYERARPKPAAKAFLDTLEHEGGEIVLCTRRDLRRFEGVTRNWMSRNGLPFDHLFMAANKVAFCALWGIRDLVDDHPFSVEHGARHGVRVHCPSGQRDEWARAAGALPYRDFDEVLSWIRASN